METGFRQFDLPGGARFFVRSTRQFKTVTVYAVWHHHLQRDRQGSRSLEDVQKEATQAALLPFLLKRGTKSYPETTALVARLEELFGADLDVDVSKKGERQLVRFRLEVANPKFLPLRFRDADRADGAAGRVGGPAGTRLLADALSVLGEVLFAPATGNADGLFRRDYFEQERDKLIRLLESRVNDKVSYATERCVEEMFVGEPFAIYRYGTVEALRALDAREMTSFYRSFAATAPLDVFVVGDLDPQEALRLVQETFLGPWQEASPRAGKETFSKRVSAGSLPTPQAAPAERGNPRAVEETLDVSQAKVSLGFLTGIGYQSPDTTALSVYGGILGGGPHSKLFQNVREKASLAYYVFARLERFKGIMVIGAGIESANYDKARDIIDEQLEAIRAGRISDYEYDATIKAMVNAIRVSQDSPGGPVEILLDGLVGGAVREPEEIIRRVESVTKEEVAAVAARVVPDATFFLHGKPGSARPAAEVAVPEGGEAGV